MEDSLRARLLSWLEIIINSNNYYSPSLHECGCGGNSATSTDTVAVTAKYRSTIELPCYKPDQ